MDMVYKVFCGGNFIEVVAPEPFVINHCWREGEEGLPVSLQSFPIQATTCSRGFMVTLWALYPMAEYLIDFGQMRGFRARTTGPNFFDGNEGIFHPELLDREDFLDCVKAQTKDYMVIVIPEEMSPVDILFGLFYHSLFAVPRRNEPSKAKVFYMSNKREGRFCIDLKKENIPWRRSKKIRRLITSGLYEIAVNRDIRDSLCLAQAYHTRAKTWIWDEYIDVLVSMAEKPQRGVYITSVELLVKETGEVLAGCLGFTLGSVYHDFTMFTPCRSKEGFGTTITKALGEALQECGYDMWYWGSRLTYMIQLEDQYGAGYIPCDEFFPRWGHFRKVEPRCSVEEYMRSGKGMFPLKEHTK